MRALSDQIPPLSSPPSLRPQRLVSTYCSSLSHGNIVLIGDSAHSMYASLGQGVNSALGEQLRLNYYYLCGGGSVACVQPLGASGALPHHRHMTPHAAPRTVVNVDAVSTFVYFDCC